VLKHCITMDLCIENDQYYCAYGFNCFVKDTNFIDIPLPQPFESFDGSCKWNVFKFRRSFKKGNNGTMVYRYTSKDLKRLLSVCQDQLYSKKVYKITGYIDFHFSTIFNKIECGKQYAVKVIPSPTYRDMVACMKEAVMNNELYITYNKFGFNNIICKPYFCNPFWNGKKWLFLIITELAEGNVLNSLRSLFYSQGQKEKIQKLIDIEISKLWWLGYSHNNLNKDHIIYNKKTDSLKLVGLSQSIGLPQNIIDCFRSNIDNFNTSFTEQYDLVFKQHLLNLIRLSSVYGRKVDVDSSIRPDDVAMCEYF
jgi:hypothetical protein